MDKTHQGGLRILFADDEAYLRELMQMELPRMGHEVTVCPDGTAALKALEKGSFDAALLDMKMPGLTGIEVLGKIRQISPETQVIILTGHATVDTAVQALRLGAFDYLTKPCKWAELEVLLARVTERRDLSNKNTALETRLKAAEGTPTLIGDTPSMQGVRRLIDTVAPTDASVMILGETGTGKELIAATCTTAAIAQSIASSRSIAVPCRKTWSRANFSATAKGRSPARISTVKGCSRSPTAARSSWMKSASWINPSR
jgi:DNA-binding NtrC family response regulator